MATIIEFLRARLDEDARVARATLWEGSGNKAEWTEEASATLSIGVEDICTLDRTVNSHIARWHPQHVLDGVILKRGIVDVHAGIDPCDEHDDSLRSIPCTTLRLLTLPYADHPDYDPAWAPETVVT